MVSLGLSMIVKDEEKVLERCLENIKEHVDEIIIVDTGSTDKTKDIAKKYTDKVFDFKWVDDFSAARNFALSKMKSDWTLILDADELINKRDMDIIKNILPNAKFSAVELIQRNYSNNHTSAKWQPIIKKDYKESEGYLGYGRNPIVRIIKNGLKIKFIGKVHEILNTSIKDLNLKVLQTEIPIHHYIEEKPLIERQKKYLEIANKALKEDPNNARLHSIVAAVNIHFTKDYDKAIEHFQKAIDLDFNQKNTCYEGIAQCYIEKKDFKSAYDIYKRLAKEGHLTHTLANNLASILVMFKHYKPAIKFYKISINLGNPNKKRIEQNIKFLEKKVQDEKDKR